MNFLSVSRNFIALLILSGSIFCTVSMAAAEITCTGCHGTLVPADVRPLDASNRDIFTGGFQGNHRTHMDGNATPAICARCHMGSDIYSTGHRDGMISISPNINNSPLPALYKNMTAAFPQTATPLLRTCTNVNCHFERETPPWGSAQYAIPAGCSGCHGAPPAGDDSGRAGSHARHDLYYTGTANCGRCHADHLSEPNPFAHATSAARRMLVIGLHDPSGAPSGAYSGPFDDYLPKSGTRDYFGTCSNTYCHSDGAAVATGAVTPNITPAWGTTGPLACDGCHGNPPANATGSPKANSHPIHVAHTLSDCSICHYGTTATGDTITDKSRHVNGVYELQPKPGYAFTYTYSPAGGSCSAISCHGDAQWGAGGSVSGDGCGSCHGHSAGYEYEPGKFSQGKGSWKSHATHTQNDGGNVKGPNIACDGCHDTASFPNFKSGNDINGDGKYSLAETDVCNTCHSPGGSYEGVNDAAFGAKNNWTFGVYSGSLLKSGKEKWCATCHDETPSVIGGISAPNVIGNESGAYPYGTGWGYYKTGHGLSSSTSIPASSGTVTGPAAACSACHNLEMPHIDGTARTYVYTAVIGAHNDYQHGYRLKSINGGLPMNIPRNNGCDSDVKANDFALCLSCHASESFIGSNSNTNFRNDSSGVNAHYYHLGIKYSCGPGPKFASDWRDHAYDSQASCITCHNVHGSTQLSMVRDGKLVNKEPGLQVAYYNPTVSYQCSGPSPYPPTPANVTLSSGTGTVWNAKAAKNLCAGCHGSCGFNMRYMRTPVNVVP